MPSSRDLPQPAVKPMSLRSLALAGGFFTTRATWEARPPSGPLTNPGLPVGLQVLHPALVLALGWLPGLWL